MTTLRCKCGKKFQVKAEMAGQVIATPCCQTKVRVPQSSPTSAKTSAITTSDRMQVKCPCGQTLAVKRPTSPIEVACPACQQRLRLGGAAKASKANAFERPVSDGLFDQLPPVGPAAPTPWMQPHTPVQRPIASAQHPGAFAQNPAAQQHAARRNASTVPRKRLPRLGILGDDFGTVSLLVCGIVFLGIFTALGLYLLLQAKDNMEMAKASEEWQATEGTILDSGFTVRGIQARKQPATTSVHYQYQVGDATYKGSTLSFEKQDSFSPEVAESMLEPYPPGTTCTVYYDPETPSSSVLIKGLRSRNQLNFWFGIGSILIGTVMLIDCILGSINACRFPPPKVPLI